ncbi:hypothetical protein SAMN04488056_101349 [Cohaesibacter marisflavi]|uniref:PepSY domain-containing protein n=1 Tax=Cohaesibacter marisflavi TaxID=655353 RepID=A0A1I5A4N0_9HYPH|nr:PepSY domain-containing protein [Cohaesibacter marisflavi]SFN57511.1 hypothetical protein SAMN04488056_101349 [Cohaesibacter marisflavi]
MQKLINKYALWALAIIAISFLVPSSHAIAAQCLGAEEIRVAISQGRAKSLVAITQAANAVVSGDVIKANLCSAGGRLNYELVILSRQGNVTRLVLDAKSGKVLSVNQ